MVELRNATGEADKDFYFKVRNDPKVWPGFYTQKEPLTESEHMNWWYTRNADWMKLIIENDRVPIGILNIGQMDYWECEIGIAVLSKYWGKGYGKEAVRMALSWLKERGRGYCRTTILDTNERSIKLFTSLGFKRMCEARPGESLYRIKI